MKIGLFGGTFNPPHLAHLVVAERVRDACNLDRIWWVPAAVPPHKTDDSGIASPSHRLAMLRRATASNDDFVVSDVEIVREGVSYTVDTVRFLKEAHAQHTFFLVMGGDMFVDFPSWRKPDEIAAHVSLIVYARPNADLSSVPARYRKAARIVETPLLDISGTDIRRRMSSGRSCRYLVPDEVLCYIQDHSLYRE